MQRCSDSYEGFCSLSFYYTLALPTDNEIFIYFFLVDTILFILFFDSNKKTSSTSKEVDEVILGS